jgi:hypothetical protein
LGQQSKFVYQYWNYDSNNWDDIWQHEFKYDEIGNNILTLETWWDGSEWTPGINFINKYDSLNHVILNLIKVWDNTSSIWTDAFQYIYGYDSLGNNNSLLLQTWNPDGDSWDNCQLETINYNSSNKVDNYLFQLWDPNLSIWYDSQRGYYKYDSIGNNICIVGEDYDQFSNTWITSWENLYDYNAQNKQISNSVLYYDAGPGNWYFGAKTKDMKIKNVVEPKHIAVATAITLEVFPNPVSDFVNIRNSADISGVQMFDILGHEVMVKNNIGLNSFQLDIANLKSGSYLMKITDSKGTSTTKRLVKR